jgi:hypothetical protein
VSVGWVDDKQDGTYEAHYETQTAGLHTLHVRHEVSGRCVILPVHLNRNVGQQTVGVGGWEVSLSPTGTAERRVARHTGRFIVTRCECFRRSLHRSTATWRAGGCRCVVHRPYWILAAC